MLKDVLSCVQLLEEASFDELLELSQTGDNKTIDMLVGDIYGGLDYSKLRQIEIRNVYGTRHIGRDHTRSLVGLMEFFCFSDTDTSSVLKEPMEYIGFLRTQVKDTESCSFRSRGLCLLPVSFTIGLAAEGNDADIWAPIKTTSPRSEKDVSQIQ